MEELSMLEKLLSEDNNDNIKMYDEDENELEFAQIAIIPWEGALYAILKPVTPMEGVGEDEALVFSVNEEDETLDVVVDEELGTAIFEEYYKLLDEEDEEE